MKAEIEHSRIILIADNLEDNKLIYDSWINGIEVSEFDTKGYGELVLKVKELDKE